MSANVFFQSFCLLFFLFLRFFFLFFNSIQSFRRGSRKKTESCATFLLVIFSLCLLIMFIFIFIQRRRHCLLLSPFPWHENINTNYVNLNIMITERREPSRDTCKPKPGWVKAKRDEKLCTKMAFLPCFDVYNAAYDLCILFVINFFIRRETHRVCTCMHCRAYIRISIRPNSVSLSFSPYISPSSPLTVALHQCINWLVAGICCESSDNCYANANGLHISTLVQRRRERGPPHVPDAPQDTWSDH